MQNSEADENPGIEARRAKLAILRTEGIAFPNDFRPDHNADGSIRSYYVEEAGAARPDSGGIPKIVMFADSAKFRGRYFYPVTKTCRYLPWRETINEVKIDLGIIDPEPLPQVPGVRPVPVIKVRKVYNAGAYIENERGAIAIPERVSCTKI